MAHVRVGSTAAHHTSPLSFLQWALDRWLSIVYGFVYDIIFERFAPYRVLEREVLGLVEAGAPPDTPRHEVRVLELGCGPGTLALSLGAAGFSVTGIDRYAALLDVAREKRRARRLTNLAFSGADVKTFEDGTFDQVVTVHALYVDPTPERVIVEAARVLKPGGHAVFVNHVRRFAPWQTFRGAIRAAGFLHALATLVWLVPNVVFEAARRPVGPHYWNEAEFARHLAAAGFTVLEVRRTFLAGGSLLVWARKESAA